MLMPFIHTHRTENRPNRDLDLQNTPSINQSLSIRVRWSTDLSRFQEHDKHKERLAGLTDQKQ